jgi:lipopolysaccharide/colanic/teichoic acid biosynthesis glycosyltransferase
MSLEESAKPPAFSDSFPAYSSLTRKPLQLLLKRSIDIVLSSMGLLLLSPLLILISVLVKLTSHGPVFYRWKILGRHGKPFMSYKFRTMIDNAEEMEEELRRNNINEMKSVYFKLKDDFRVTFLGRILRKFSLDELPQLISVIKGDMSLVGPRPVRIHERDELKPWHQRRFSVRPGATSPWVVNGKNKIDNFDEIVKMDLAYIENWSLILDIKLILKTFPILLLGKNC